MKRIGFTTRLTPDNHKWLEGRAKLEERSMTYILDKTLTEAREADEARQEADNADNR